VNWLESMASEDDGRRYALSVSFFRFTDATKQNLYTDRMKGEVAGSDVKGFPISGNVITHLAAAPQP